MPGLNLDLSKTCKSLITVKSVSSGHSKIDKTKILMANSSLMKVESIAKCFHSAILLTCIKR